MEPTISTSIGNPRDITKTLKRLSIEADKLGTLSGHFISWPVDPRYYESRVEWIAPLSFEFLVVDDTFTVLCKVLDLDYFVNLFFMRKDDTKQSSTVLTFVLENKELDIFHEWKIGRALAKAIDKNNDKKKKLKQPQPLTDFHQIIHRECQDPSLCLLSTEIEGGDTVNKQIVITRSYGEQTPESLVRTLQG